MDWRDLIDHVYPKDIQTLEHRLALYFEFYKCKNSEPREPYVTVVDVNDTKTLAVLWHTEEDKRIIFPISEPACPEAEYVNPSEWQVIFIGAVEQLLESKLRDRFKVSSTDSSESQICLLALREKMQGFGGRDMSQLVFPCTVVIRVEQGQVIAPRLYCDEDWQPPEYQRKLERFTETQYI